jgi:hypothetical protein
VIKIGKQINDLVLLTILQNQIKNAVDENKVDTSKFARIKHFENVSSLTQSEKTDVSENLYDFLIDDYSSSVYVSLVKIPKRWKYVRMYTEGTGYVLLTENGLLYTRLGEDKVVKVDASGSVTFTDCVIALNIFPLPQDFILTSEKYPDTVFHANYYSKTADSIIYRFSSGIILDSSSEATQYKIVFASYNVKAAKVTFVEKVLS